MQTRTVERVETWDTRPFSGGAAALTSLADADFSGAVVADDVWLFFVNGRPVGVYGGTTEDVAAAASGTVYEAPDLALPLLFAMQEADGETRARYYTNDTPLTETDDTLKNAGFTGYVELSENVLSGDYYVAYYGGRPLPAAFVGNTPEVLTGDEAFERAADEVGLYEVVSVDLEFPDLPDADEGTTTSGASDSAAAAAASTTSASAATREGPSEESSDGGVTEPSTTPETDTDAATVDDAAAESADTSGAVEASEADTADTADEAEATEDGAGVTVDAGATEERDAAAEHEEDADESEEPDDQVDATAATADTDGVDATVTAANTEPEEPTGETSSARPSVESPGAEAVEQTPTARATRESTSEPTSETTETATGSSDVFHEEEAWRETTRVPTLAPDEEAEDSSAAGAEAAETGSATASRPTRAAQTAEARSRTSRESREETVEAEPARDGRLETLESELAAREERIEALEERLESAQDDVAARERDLEDVRAERDDLRETVDRLEERIATLEADLEAARESAQTGAGDLSPVEAIAGTNLFVRYESKAEPTLEDLGEAEPSAIDANLTLEHHTTFDAADATVEGEPYEAFLHGTAAYRFVSWAVRELPVEVLETGHRKGLADLYEAIPSVDRAELGGTVELSDEEGETVRRDFDVVLRDRMGDPLAVAALNTSRDPVTGDEMETLTESASAVGEVAESLGAALYVTASFFEPDALEVADEAAASGGLLRRSEKESYVKVSRKRGYHLCLVEDRNGSFHVTVPEL
ncbi:DUF7527 domain-containing protein [Halarchaeum sp. P4]|uniref:DUF7527 domain-containing protein n=1 Tax=Halarchaeum sp. P4 TaxID=3421639 RepID=UPI003EB69D32